MLRSVEGFGAHQIEGGMTDYIFTIDNLLKMLSIQLRLKYLIPVVIMGETGCGKSSLMKQLCAVTGMRLRTFDIHGGVEDSDVVEFMERCIDEVSQLGASQDQRLIVFFDEVNTCNSMGLFKEIVCDHSMNGVPLPASIRTMAACNPYRLRPEALRKQENKEEAGGETGLVFEHHMAIEGNEDGAVGTGIHDPLKDLVYRVHPLPESMIDFIFDFGALSKETEELYVKAMIKSALKKAAGMDESEKWSYYKSAHEELCGTYAALISASQEFIREQNDGERSSASLRDVHRCIQVFTWFAKWSCDTEAWSEEDFFNVRPIAHRAVRRAVILSLAYTYQARLGRSERSAYRIELGRCWRA